MSTAFNFRAAEISFLFTNDAGIRKLHHRFMKKKTTTDVMTFVDEKTVEVVISLDRAAAQARPRGVRLFHEVTLLMCHGLLHAKGFDDLNEKDSLLMRQKEFEWLAKILY